MAEQIAILKVKLDANGVIVGARVADQGLDKVKKSAGEMSKKTDQSTTALNKFGKIAGVVRGALYGAAAYTLYRSINKVINATEAHENSIVKLNAVLKATDGQVGMTSQQFQGWAAQLQDVTGIQDELLLNSQAVMLTFTQISGEVMPRAMRAMMDTAEVFGGLDQATIQLGKALNDPMIGLTALRRIGISFNAEQSEMIKGLAKAGDLLGAQSEILAEIEREYGGVADAMGTTFTKKKSRAMAEFNDLLESVGEKLTKKGGILYTGLDGVNNILDSVNDKMSEHVLTLEDLGRESETAADGLERLTTAQYYYNQGILPGDIAPPFNERIPGGGVKTDAGPTEPKPFKIKLRRGGMEPGMVTTVGRISPDDVLSPGIIRTVEEVNAEIEQTKVNAENAKYALVDLDEELSSTFKTVGDTFDDEAFNVKLNAVTTEFDKMYDHMTEGGVETAAELDNSFTKFFENNKDLIDDWKDNFTDAIMNLTTDGAGAFGDFFDYVGKGILRLGISKYMTEPIFGGISSILGKAGGGPVVGGASYVVGERGPEIFTPGTSGTVHSNAGIGKAPVVQIIDNRTTSSPPLTATRQTSRSGDIIRVVVEEVKGAMNAGEFNSVLQNKYGLMPQGRG